MTDPKKPMDEKEKLVINFPVELKRQLAAAGALQGRNLTEQLETVVKEWLEKNREELKRQM